MLSGNCFDKQISTYWAIAILVLIQPAFTCSKLTLETPEQCHWSCSDVFIVNFEQIDFTHCCAVFIVNFEQVSADWKCYQFYWHAIVVYFKNHNKTFIINSDTLLPILSTKRRHQTCIYVNACIHVKTLVSFYKQL